MAGQAAGLQPLDHAHQRYAHIGVRGLAQPQQQLRPAEREQLAIDRLDRPVEIGPGHQEGDRRAVHFGDAHQIGADQRFELLADISDLAVADRHEAPVVAPRIVKDAKDDLRILVEVLEVHLANTNAWVLFARSDYPADQRVEFLGDIKFIRHQALGDCIAFSFNPALHVGGVVPHHHHRRMIVPQREQAGFVPDRQAERGEYAGHALVAQPLLGARDQGVRDRAVFSFEHSPVAGARPHTLHRRDSQREMIDMRRDPAHDLVRIRSLGAPREKQLHLGVFEERIFARGQQFLDVAAQGRNPVRVAGVEPVCKVDEGVEVGLAGYGQDHDFAEVSLVLGHGLACHYLAFVCD